MLSLHWVLCVMVAFMFTLGDVQSQNRGVAGMGPKQTVGTIGSAAAGAVAGAAIANQGKNKYKYKKQHVQTPGQGTKTYYTKQKKKHHGRDQAMYAVGGALLGGLIGSVAGQQMDNRDKLLSQDAARKSLDRGGSYHWTDRQDGSHGRSRVISAPRDSGNCKMLNTDVYDASGRRIGNERRLYCRDNQGNWRAH